MYSLMIHGGAGSLDKLTEAEQRDYHESLNKIITEGDALLKSGRPAFEVVEVCTMMLEDDPLFNAGRGSVLNEDGEIEMDAAIMNGIDLKAGAIAGVRFIRNPIHLARLVLEKTEHVMLIGTGAQKFAKLERVPQEPMDYFLTDKRTKQWEEAREKDVTVLDLDKIDQETLPHEDPKKYGTVGAVALDKDGNLAAATSTGGIVNKHFGRVGDSPIVGAGVYADNNTCACSASGYGEQFIRLSMCKTVSALMEYKGLNGIEAANEAIRELIVKVRGMGGVIVVDKDGNCKCAYSTGGMIRAWAKEGEGVHTELF
jgi:beta-aspartyl-peptidase (threonine type)